MAIAGTVGFVLVFLESYFVMVVKGYTTIEFGGISPFVGVWAMNFFFVFSILTHVKLWYDERALQKEEAQTDSN
ncbi:hypothetical protein [Bacillus sp. FJAT-27245]|uniref:hypothetical protein n=1 Tax=Bacillus sp. FJAT-27245 TaxID=1684144 RepID=UPI001E560F9B|nr:hypothetical protein [Bacillus sp. FJAT-27245]